MNTKLILSSSAVALGFLGVVLIFAPDVAVGLLLAENNYESMLAAQLLGALYFGFAMINWMSKSNLIGGIYNRPLAVGNFTHFMIGGITLAKLILANPGLPYSIWTLGIVYGVYGVSFALILFRHPLPEGS